MYAATTPTPTPEASTPVSRADESVSTYLIRTSSDAGVATPTYAATPSKEVRRFGSFSATAPKTKNGSIGIYAENDELLSTLISDKIDLENQTWGKETTLQFFVEAINKHSIVHEN